MTAPAFLPPDWRYAGDDWAGANALTYLVFETAPIYAADGVTVTTPAVPRDLQGCTVRGVLCAAAGLTTRPQPTAATALVAMTGAVLDASAGMIALSLPATRTGFARQPLSAWGEPGRALLIVQPRIVDATGNVVTVGLQPLFVF